MKISFSVKLGVGSMCAFFFIILVGFVGFPKMIKSKVKQMVNLRPGSEIREMFLELPFPLNFKVYLFNITNPTEIQNGALPEVNEIGPFCYNEWKEKMNVSDDEKSDTISYLSKDTFIKTTESGCHSGQLEVTIPNIIILGFYTTVKRIQPGALSLTNKAIKSVFNNTNSFFLTAKVDDILFNGVEIKCDATDFAGKAVCVKLRQTETIQKRDNNILAFSFFGLKNSTLQKSIKALRGTKNYHDVGRIVEYNESATMSVWPTKKCNSILGTDGTIFPPMSERELGLINFSPDICRSLTPFWVKKTKYDGIPVNKYTASLGDMSKNEEEKCYCYTPDSCLKKGLMDLYNCNGVPIYVSMPHFYDSDKTYLEGIKGLKPKQEDHEISILFEHLTGTPVQVRKRLQFNMPLESSKKVDLFRNITDTIIPLFWIEEGLDLNRTFTKPLKMLYMMKKVMNILTWLLLVSSLGGMAAAGYLFFTSNYMVTTVNDKKNIKTEISTVGAHINKSNSETVSDK